MKRTARSESGLTLVELLISIVILSMITGAISAAFVTALNSARPTAQRARESSDAQLIASYLARDAQSAGGTNPSFGTADPTLGVSVPATAPDCVSTPGQLVVRFAWQDRAALATVHSHVANYFFDSADNRLVRKACVDGAQESLLELTNVASVADAVCVTNGAAADCPAAPASTLPDLVQLTITATHDPTNPTPYTYTLTGSTRAEDQGIPDESTSTLVPLLALGGSCGDGITGVQAQGGGASTVTVYGAAEVNGGCPAVDFQGSINLTATGGISVLSPGTCSGVTPACGSYTSPVGDPFATLPPPSADCVNGTHAGPAGTTYSPGVYKTAVNVSNATFLPGIYIFCNGLTTSGTVNATGVLFYFAGGSMTVSAGDFSATAATSGIYGSGPTGANIVVWQSLTNTAHTVSGVAVCCSNTTNATFGGTLYAPRSFVDLHNGNIAVTSIIALGVSWEGGGNGGTTIGTAPADPLLLTTSSLPAWTVNRVYPNTTLTATGGSTGYTWSATGLPQGLNLDPLTGIISGTPTTVTTASVTVTVVDSIGESMSKTFTLRINDLPLINGPATLPNWTVDRDYPGTAMTATLGTTQYSWTAAGLPTGLTIPVATNGVISGTPTVTGTFHPVITLTDAAGATTTRNYTVTINAAPTITGPATLPAWTAGQAYPAQTMTRTNGTTPFTWSASGLPTGLNINAGTGVISGTPTTAGTFAATVTVTDTAGSSASRAYSVTINPAPGIATGSLANGERSRPYSFTVMPTAGGTPPYTWTAANLPAGLTMGLNTGTISGTPTVNGTFNNVLVTVKDAANATASKTYTLAIAQPVSISGPATLPNWTVTRDYPGTQIVAANGVAPFAWSATGLPTGLTINGTSGVVSGTPSAAGTFAVSVTVTDALGGTVSRAYSVTINNAPTISTATLPNGERTVGYAATVAAAGGTPNAGGQYTWAASGLPTGLTMNVSTGVISGTPTQAGAFDITVTATDTAGASISKIFLAVPFAQPPTISGPAALPNGTVSVAYPSTLITSSGGTAPLVFSATGLPPGLTIDAVSGIISGMPSAAGTYAAVVVKITDAFNATITANYSVTISSAPTITTGSLPSSTVDRPYPSINMTAGGGTAPLSWSAIGLPGGLTISAAGVISGTPTTVGAFTPTVTVTDSAGATGTKNFSVTINAAPAITSSTLPDGAQGVAYNFSVAGTNGSLPYTWSAAGLPGGLTITGGGLISGSPTVTGDFTVNVTLIDASGATAAASLPLRINSQITITAPGSLAAWTVNRGYPAVTATATGGTGAYTWSATNLPAGLTIDPASGVISGTPTVTVTNATVTVMATDTATPPQTKSRNYTLTIHTAPTIATVSCTVKKNTTVGFTLAVTAGTGTGPFTWSGSGEPSWVVVNATGTLGANGNAPGSGSFPFNLTVTDAAGASSTSTFTVTVINGNGSC
jgi:Tfp pilus assembly protein PilV